MLLAGVAHPVGSEPLWLGSAVAAAGAPLRRTIVFVAFAGEGLSLGVNPDYLSDFLHAAATERVRLEVKDENSQCVAYPVDGHEKRYVCVIMPIKL